jgi:hypothetical protein
MKENCAIKACKHANEIMKIYNISRENANGRKANTYNLVYSKSHMIYEA